MSPGSAARTPSARFPAGRGPQTAGGREELAKRRAIAKLADVHRHRRLLALFGKPSQRVTLTLAQTQALSYLQAELIVVVAGTLTCCI